MLRSLNELQVIIRSIEVGNLVGAQPPSCYRVVKGGSKGRGFPNIP